MAEDVTRLISRRATYKIDCTKNIKAAEKMMTSSSPSMEELKTLLEIIVTKMEVITELDENIEANVDDTALGKEIEDALDYHDNVTSDKNKIAKFIRENKKEEMKEMKGMKKMKELSGDPLEWRLTPTLEKIREYFLREIEAREKSGCDQGETEKTLQCSLVTGGSILLQTARVTVESPHKTRKTRMLFDTGSQRTFISKRLATYLKCQIVGEETLAVSAFGTTGAAMRVFEVVKVTLTTDKEIIMMTALVSSAISAPISVNVDSDWRNIPDFEGLKFADNVVGEQCLTIDIIIGNDYYARLLTGEVIKVDGLLAMNSKFGWLLCGRTQSDSNTGDASKSRFVQQAEDW